MTTVNNLTMTNTTETQTTLTRQSWSVNEEIFDYDTLADLIDSQAPELGQTVFVGDVVHPDPLKYFDADDALEMMGERAYDDCGESAENYPDVSKEARAELDALLAQWISKHAKPDFYRVVNIKPHTITAEDLA